MNKISHVSGRPACREIGAFAQVDDFARSRRLIDGQAAPLHEFHHRLINRDFGERLFVVFAARGMAIGAFHQLRNRALAVAGDVGRNAFAGRCDSSVDYEHTVIAAYELLLDDDFRRVLFCDAAGLLDLRGRGEIERDAFALAHVERFDDDRRPDNFQSFDGFSLRLRKHPIRNFDPGVSQQCLCQFLVGRDVNGDGAGLFGHRSLYEAAMFSITELHKTVFTDAPPGNAAARGGFGNRFCGWAEFGSRDELSGFTEPVFQRERLALQQRFDNLHRHPQ
ncbi:MAG: hypothetical protein JMDDDDMK_04201 [Acidobacteria bacterium]|nr:hypothetical protein [Acidobacteriota bacterium]